jgi:hypothetical protein
MTANISNESGEVEQNDQQKAVGKFENVNNINAKFGMLQSFISSTKCNTHRPKSPIVKIKVEIPTSKISPNTYR